MKHLAVLAKCRARCVRESNSVSESRFFEEMKVRPITVDSTTFVPGKVWRSATGLSTDNFGR
jgi:hypothetical protein